MRFAIVDDDDLIRLDTERKIADHYGRINVSCFLFSDGDEIVNSVRNGFRYDAIFLDIEMERTDGLSAARTIRQIDKDIPIIFLTSHTDLAMEGYEVNAFRFLAKPVSPGKLRQALSDLELLLTADNKITLTADGEENVYPVKDLVYAEASNNSVRFFIAGNDPVETRMKFSSAVTMLDQYGSFCKIHRSYLVNLGHVKKVNASDVITDTGTSLPIARGKGPEVRKALLEYIRRTGR